MPGTSTLSTLRSYWSRDILFVFDRTFSTANFMFCRRILMEYTFLRISIIVMVLLDLNEYY